MYYTHIQKLNDCIKKDSFNKISQKYENRCDSTSSLNIKQKAYQPNEKSTLNSETVKIFTEANNTNSHHRSIEEFLQKVENMKDENSLKANEGNKLKYNIPNNSDFTDLSSTKSGRPTIKEKEANIKLVKAKVDFDHNIQEKIAIKRINTKKSTKSSIVQGSESVEEEKLADSNRIINRNHELENRQTTSSLEKGEKSAKGTYASSIHNISISESKEFFTNELS